MSDVVLDPKDVPFWYPLREVAQYRVLVSTSVTGKEQRRLLHTSPIRHFEVNFGLMTKTIKDTLETFYDARYGTYDTFYFPNNNARVTSESIGDKSATETHTLASYPSGNIYLWDDAGVRVEDTDYSVNRITGVITFIEDVTGAYVSYDPAIYVRFEEPIEYEERRNGLFVANAKLIEVLA